MGKYIEYFHLNGGYLANLNVINSLSQVRGTSTYCINPHSFVCQIEDERYFKAMRSCSYLLPDGIGFVLGVQLAYSLKLARITGLDFYRKTMRVLDREHASIAYIGSDRVTLNELKINVERKYHRVSVHTYAPPFKDEFSHSEIFEMKEFLNNCDPDFVWVGLTAPKQEKLIFELRESFPKIGWGAIGAVFDYVAFPQKKRPPELIRAFGLEWLYRLIQNPKKMWRRTIISLPKFLKIVISERFT